MSAQQLSEEQLEEAALRLSGGRIRAIEQAPYMSAALLSLTPVPMPGFGTFAVDNYWHMYYDPAMCLKWTISEIAAVWLHEVNHVIRQHGKRFEQYNEPQHARQWNAAADAAINSDLKEMGVVLPDPDIRYYAQPGPQTPGWSKEMTAEQMYEIVRGSGGSQKQEKGSGQPPQDQSGQGEPQEADRASGGNETSDDTSQQDSSADSSSTPEESEDQSGSPGQGEGDPSDSDPDSDADAGSQGSAGDSESNDDSEGDPSGSGASGEGDSEGESQDDAAGSGSSSSQTDPSGADDNSGSEQESGASGESGEGDPSGAGGVGCDCGSGADGIPRPEDLGEDDTAVTSGQADAIARTTAEAIRDYEKSRPGSVPAGMKRIAKDILDPEVNWQRALIVKIRSKVAEIVGLQDYSYSRPSRRRQSGSFIFPSMKSSQKPYIYIIIDTSGSMSDEDLARALSEIAAIMKRFRGRVYVITCDAEGTEAALVRNLKDIELMGGGGTDMRKGIRKASESRPKPDIVMVITDGYTPWPKTVPKAAPRAKYIALIVEMRKSTESAARRHFKLPEWFDVITVNRR